MVGLADLLERLQRPRGAVAHEPEDGAEVVREDDVREPPAVTEARGLEDLFVLLFELCGALGVRRRDCGGVGPGVALVDGKQFLRDVLRGL